jgi:hypothetical protein
MALQRNEPESQETMTDESSNEEKELPSTPTVFSNTQNFLHLLRASDSNFEDQNADTLRAGNGDNSSRTMNNLSTLFEPPENGESAAPAEPKPKELVKLEISPKRPPRLPRPVPVENHNRNRSVSFDKNTVFTSPADGVLKQPITLDEADDDSFSTRWQSAFPSLHQRNPSASNSAGNHSHRRLSSNKSLTIDDLLNAGPYEAEAETNILKILEEQQQQQKPSHNRYSSDTSSILTGVPEDLSHDFTYEDNAYPSERHGSLNSRQAEADFEEESNRSKESLVKQSRPLLIRERPHNHRRTMSVEDRLADLTFAMQTLEVKKGNANLDSQTTSSRTSGSSGDQLGRNAVLITRHETEAQSIGKLSPGGRRSSVHVDMLPVLEEDKEGKSGAFAYSNASSDDIEEQASQTPEARPQAAKRESARRLNCTRRSNVLVGAADKLKEDWDIWQSFFSPRKQDILKNVKIILLYLAIPFIGTAAILFYLTENPPTGNLTDGATGNRASAAWWLLFCVRQGVTFSFSLTLQIIVIDFLSIGTRVMLRLLGPLLTLLIMQSKGWPFVVLWWAIFDFCLLYGKSRFAKHWGY